MLVVHPVFFQCFLLQKPYDKNVKNCFTFYTLKVCNSLKNHLCIYKIKMKGLETH